jgi:hypothetical protein
MRQARRPLAPLLAPARRNTSKPTRSLPSPPRCWHCRPRIGRGLPRCCSPSNRKGRAAAERGEGVLDGPVVLLDDRPAARQNGPPCPSTASRHSGPSSRVGLALDDPGASEGHLSQVV